MITKFNYAGMTEIINETVEICNKMLGSLEEMKAIATSTNSHFEWSGPAAEHYVKMMKNIDDIIYAIQFNLANAIYYEQLIIDQHREYETIIMNGGVVR